MSLEGYHIRIGGQPLQSYASGIVISHGGGVRANPSPSVFTSNCRRNNVFYVRHLKVCSKDFIDFAERNANNRWFNRHFIHFLIAIKHGCACKLCNHFSCTVACWKNTVRSTPFSKRARGTERRPKSLDAFTHWGHQRNKLLQAEQSLFSSTTSEFAPPMTPASAIGSLTICDDQMLKKACALLRQASQAFRFHVPCVRRFLLIQAGHSQTNVAVDHILIVHNS